jgi:tetratricopeptide (TPR) repeat protein
VLTSFSLALVSAGLKSGLGGDDSKGMIAFSPDGEANEFLRKFKASRVGKWKLTNSKSLWEACDLACYFWALGRVEEARAVCQWTAGVEFAGNFNIWTPVAFQRALLAHLDEDDAWMAAVRANPSHGYHPAFVRDSVNQNIEETSRGLVAVEGGIENIGDARSRMLLALRRTLSLLQDHKYGILKAKWLQVDTLQDYQSRALKMLALAVDPQAYSTHGKAAVQQGSSGELLAAAAEPNKHLKKFKAKREGKWDFQNPDMLRDAGELAIYLFALERFDEAAELASLTFDAKSNCSHYDALRVAAYLHTRAGRTKEALKVFQQVLDVPSGWTHPRTPKQAEDQGNYWHRIEWHLGAVESGEIKESGSARRLSLACTLGNALDLWLRGALDAKNFGWYPLKKLESQVELGARLLREALAT